MKQAKVAAVFFLAGVALLIAPSSSPAVGTGDDQAVFAL
jgi:hypothetical protein